VVRERYSQSVVAPLVWDLVVGEEAAQDSRTPTMERA
jgi:hypothetical protein